MHIYSLDVGIQQNSRNVEENYEQIDASSPIYKDELAPVNDVEELNTDHIELETIEQNHEKEISEKIDPIAGEMQIKSVTETKNEESSPKSSTEDLES